MTNFNINGRTFQVTEKQEYDFLAKDLIARGFDGVIYYATSTAKGRQRKDISGMFFRSVKTGQFISAIN